MVSSLRLTNAAITRIAKASAALFALYITYSLWTSLLVYATEPKVIGGVDLDRPIPQAMPWSPVYVPMVLAALFAYWAWPKRPHDDPVVALLRGAVAAICIVVFSLFISFLCPGLGEFYLMLPDLMRSEIPMTLARTALAALLSTLFFGGFFAIPLLTSGIVAGSAIASASHMARTLFSAAPVGAEAAASAGDLSLSQPGILRNLVVLAAVIVSAAILIAGLHFHGIFVFTFWARGFVQMLIPCALLGAGTAWIRASGIWCVAASLPIGFYLSTTHANPDGLLNSQSLDFPPVLFATLLGFGLMRRLRSKTSLR